MASDLEIRCTCGAVEGVAHEVSRRHVNRVVCYCDDCQAFAHYLGRAAEVLDAHGGTDILQMSPAHLELRRGAEHLACMRLTPKGTCRWYTECCRTPIGNTLATAQLPFVGLIAACIEGGKGRDAVDLAVGPVRGRVWGRFAKGDTHALENLYPGPPVWMAIKLVGSVLKWRLRGDARRSPFFDAGTGKIAVTPHVLSAAELARVKNARDGVVEAG